VGPTLTCKVKVPTSGASYVLCRIHDPDGVRRFNVVNTATGVREQSISLPSRPPIKTVSFKIPITGDAHRVTVTDLAGHRTRSLVSADGTVTPL